MRAVAYIRVSSDKQAKNGLSLEAQDTKLRAMAIIREDELVDVVVDEESAKPGSLKREGVQRVLAMVRKGEVDAVIVCKLDRLTRSIRDLAELLETFEKHNVALVSLAESLDTKSASGRLVINIMTAVSQWEREAIGERTKAVMDFKKARGERLGNIPYGWEDDGHGILQTHFGEQQILRYASTLRENKYDLTKIASLLNKDGYRTRHGGEWRREYVSRILKAS